MSGEQTRRTGGSVERSLDDRWLAGVAGGLGRHLGVDPIIIRLALIVMAFASGVGLLVYLVAWAVMPAAEGAVAPRRRPGPGTIQRSVAVGLVTVGVLLAVRQTGIFFPDGLVWPATMLAAGLAFVWNQADDADRARWRARAGSIQGDPVSTLSGGRGAVIRLAIGVVLLFAGLVAFVAGNEKFAAAGAVAMAVLAAAVGVALLLGPWIARLFRELGVERRERIRGEERAEMAAHLHDSVLQTLALIQRRADSPAETIALARRQERELRAWLYGRTEVDGPDSVARAFSRLVDEVEAAHPVTVDLVMVGDLPLDEGRRALVAASKEATMNAAKHAGVSEISIYVEAAPAGVTVFVRDRGVGFDPDHIDPDRQGLAASVIGRMHRHGGEAVVTSKPGDGTEVVLELIGSDSP